MSLEFQEQSEDRQFEPGREHCIFFFTIHQDEKIKEPRHSVWCRIYRVVNGGVVLQEHINKTEN